MEKLSTFGSKIAYPSCFFMFFLIFSHLKVDGGDPQCHVLRQPLPAKHQERSVLMIPMPSALLRDARLSEDLDFRLHKHLKRLL